MLTLKNAHIVTTSRRLQKYGLKSFRSYGAKIWNVLPRKHKSAMNLADFKDIDYKDMEWIDM